MGVSRGWPVNGLAKLITRSLITRLTARGSASHLWTAPHCSPHMAGEACPTVGPMQVGGTPALLKYLLAHNLIDGSCMVRAGACCSPRGMRRGSHSLLGRAWGSHIARPARTWDASAGRFASPAPALDFAHCLSPAAVRCVRCACCALPARPQTRCKLPAPPYAGRLPALTTFHPPARPPAYPADCDWQDHGGEPGDLPQLQGGPAGVCAWVGGQADAGQGWRAGVAGRGRGGIVDCALVALRSRVAMLSCSPAAPRFARGQLG